MTTKGFPPTMPVVAEAVDLVRQDMLLLDSVTLRIDAGEHWALLGPNGAGKSTLLSLLGAQQHPTRGQVWILGRRMGRVDVFELRRRIGHVDPRHPVRDPLTAHEVVLTGVTGTNVLMPRWCPSPDDVLQADELLDLMGMAKRRDAAWPVLSQGERGRALIARALIGEPELLLLDEPATGLDVAAREQLLTAIDQLHRRHPELASVLVTHHLEELPVTTTHAALISHGRLVADGLVDDVLTTARVSEAFEHPIGIGRRNGRWAATAEY